MISNNWTVVEFSRAVTAAGRRLVRKELLDGARRSDPLIVDFAGCATLDCQQIELLLEAMSHATGRNAEVLLVAHSRSIQILLDVTRISSLIPVLHSMEEMVRHFESVANGRSAPLYPAT